MSPSDRTLPVIGLVGGIGAGKSAAAACFAQLGAAVIDADALGHQVLHEPAVRAELVARWGPEALGPDGRVDRQAVGAIVFPDPSQLAFLESLTHPRISDLIRRGIEAARAKGAPAAVLDAAVLVEAGWDRYCTHLVYVHAPAAQRARRVRQRGWDEAAWRGRENSQISLDKKAARCNYRLKNSSSLSRLREQVRRVFHQIIRSPEPI